MYGCDTLFGFMYKYVLAPKRAVKLANVSISPADAGFDLDLWYIENILTDYDSQHLQTSEFS